LTPTEFSFSGVQEFEFAREFFYFHHLYSQWKRKLMLQWGRDLDLTGFVYPGKPGTVCVEGDADAVREFGIQLRSLQWQKLSSRHRDIVQHIPDFASLQSMRKFDGFTEMSGDFNSLHADQVCC
jgi:hypothetical protein